ncbi:MAG: ABC transporter ATP-binding protein [Planctomycetota bacterium]
MILQLENVTKLYGGFKALDDLTVSIRPGAIGLLGPNGAGKSTLIKALLGLVRLTHGQATVLGHDARTESRQIREIVGYMPEDDCTIPGMKGVEAVAYAGELAGLPKQISLRRAHEILDFVSLYEERYREVQTYSTGMRQKVKLAQSLIHSPKLVFLDEPANGLDPVGRERMLALIRTLYQKKGISVIVSTHILGDIEECCDAVLILGRGRLLVYDEIATLRQSTDPSYQVRFDGDAAAFRAGLESRGCQFEVIKDRHWRVSPGDAGQDVPRCILEAARDARIALRSMDASRNTLEEIFLQAVQSTSRSATPLETSFTGDR